LQLTAIHETEVRFIEHVFLDGRKLRGTPEGVFGAPALNPEGTLPP